MKQKIITLLILSMFPLGLFALSMEDCEVDKVAYIDDWIDKKIVIKKCDYSDNTIQVKDSKGNLRWVKPSDLIGKLGKAIEDYFEDKLLDIISDAISNSENNK